MKWGDSIRSGCQSFDFGEVEDYQVILIKKYIDPCTNGLQDEGEQGIDCGPHCTPCALTYCISSGTNSKYEYIKKITWNDIPYSTGNNNGYRDFTESVITITDPRKINFQFEAGFAGNYILTEFWMLYADWNKDGDFDDENEIILKSSSTIPLKGSFTIPEHISGKIRLRVIMTDAGNTKSCGPYAFGETEDYMIEVAEVQLRKNTVINKTGRLKIYPIPANQYLYIQLTTGDFIREIIIRNFLGQVVYRVTELSELIKFDCSYLEPGNYMMTVFNEDKTSYQSKIAIAH